MKRFIPVAAIVLSQAVFVAPALAGGPIAFNRTEVVASDYSAYLSCSCDSGVYEVLFENDDSVPLTIKGTGWQVGPIAAGESATYTFNDPGEYTYKVDGYSPTGKVTILNQPPQFTSEALLVTALGTTTATLQWPVLNDDGPGVVYKLYKNDVLIKSDSATSVTLTDLEPGTRYFFRLEGYDNAGLKAVNVLTNSPTTKKSTPKPSVAATAAPSGSSSTSTPATTSPTTDAESFPTLNMGPTPGDVAPQVASFSAWGSVLILILVVGAVFGLDQWRARFKKKTDASQEPKDKE